jgi:hypothetical protein
MARETRDDAVRPGVDQLAVGVAATQVGQPCPWVPRRHSARMGAWPRRGGVPCPWSGLCPLWHQGNPRCQGGTGRARYDEDVADVTRVGAPLLLPAPYERRTIRSQCRAKEWV